ncbi:DeoR/GlpR family DNA-binding transcription regulator [Embleya sp. NPDC050154]|uniref:DeoR/GlpR family DNA-binding transcription regulator n=1 Tax=Embleya sp. NPDC050154 TaxID=3363988 RepID=UPI0037B8A3F3
MLRNERHARIFEHVSAHGSVSVEELAGILAVSAATVRRDLRHLDASKLLRRTHGGASLRNIGLETPMRYRSERRRPEKLAIARAAAALVPAKAVVGLNGGSTTTEIARLLADRGPVTIVTNAVNIAAELLPHQDVTLVVIGGTARNESYELVRSIAEKPLAEYYTDVTFLGVDGISATHGCTTHDQVEAVTDRAFTDRSSRTVVVADNSKIGKVTLARICPLSAIAHLVTDHDAPKDELARITDAGVLVTVA